MKRCVFAIGDLHLSGAVNKPMDVFGSQWIHHWDRIQEDWRKRVGQEDIVLIPGDISWAMKLEDAEPDLLSIGRLPGEKIMIRGNHDYWWSSLSRLRSILPPAVHVLQNDSFLLDGIAYCGTRGWIHPGTKDFGEHDTKIYKRELQRLKLSLDHANRSADSRIVLLHYPPFGEGGRITDAVRILEQYQPSHVVYGHLHGEGTRDAFEGEYKGTRYHLVSCDHIGFRLKRIA